MLVGVFVGVFVTLGVIVGVGVSLLVGVIVGVTVLLGVILGVGVIELVAVTVGVAVGVGVLVGVLLGNVAQSWNVAISPLESNVITYVVAPSSNLENPPGFALYVSIVNAVLL